MFQKNAPGCAAIVFALSALTASASEAEKASVKTVERYAGRDAGEPTWVKVKTERDGCKLPAHGTNFYRIQFSTPGIILFTLDGTYGPNVNISIHEWDAKAAGGKGRQIMSRVARHDFSIPWRVRSNVSYRIESRTSRSQPPPPFIVLNNEVLE